MNEIVYVWAVSYNLCLEIAKGREFLSRRYFCLSIDSNDGTKFITIEIKK